MPGRDKKKKLSKINYRMFGWLEGAKGEHNNEINNWNSCIERSTLTNLSVSIREGTHRRWYKRTKADGVRIQIWNLWCPKNLFIFRTERETLVTTDCFALISNWMLGHFCHLAEWKYAFLWRKEINYTALLHKSADAYSTLTLKAMLGFFFISTTERDFHSEMYKNFIFFSFAPIIPSRYATEQKKSFIKFKFIVCDEVIVSCCCFFVISSFFSRS